MVSNDISLEGPFPTYALPRIWNWIESFREKVFDDYGPKTCDEFVQDWLRMEKRGRRSWAVTRRGDLGGVVTAAAMSPVVAEMHCVFGREFWGHATTVPALTLVYELLLSEGFDKITACVTADNHALIALLKKFGGVREGLLKGQQRRDGVPSDLVIMGLHKEDFYVARRRIQQREQLGNEHEHHIGDRSNVQNIRAGDGGASVDVRVVPDENLSEPLVGNGAGAGHRA